MRPQPDLPRRPSRRERKAARGSRFAGRGRLVVGIVLAGLFVLLISLRGIASFYTDFLWFQSLDLAAVWRTVLRAKLSLTVIGGVAFFLLCAGNLAIAERLAPAFRPSSGDDDLIERYHELVGDRTGLVRYSVSITLAVMVGASLGSSWNEWVLFTNAVDWGTRDATFDTDIGFYVFRLPFLTTVAAWLFSALILVLILTLLAHIVNGGIRFHTQLDRVTPQVKAHVSVLLAALALVQGGRYWLDRYQLTFSTRGVVDGATYTDYNVQLRVIYLLIAISIFATALFIANIWRRGWVLPAMAVGLWIFVTVLAGALVPAFVQRFRVEPAESSMEAPYITQNIEATREAYGLGDVEREQFDFQGDLSNEDLLDDAATVRNIRLWDAPVMQLALQRAQQIKSFYAFNDVDVDRYEIDGKMTQVMVSARNLRTSGVPQSSWEATHLAYTHGYGVVVARANAKTSNGGPSLVSEDIPVRTSEGFPETDADRQAIYFGENKSGYVIVNTGRQEIDYQDASNKTKLTRYAGADGVRIGSGLTGFLRKSAFALRFGDINPLISGNVKAESRVLLERDITARLDAVAPFLAYDHDPYVVLLDGKVRYVVDAYTTTRNYPNAERADTGGLDAASGLRGRSFNYARNSVKAVVDAYDGTVDLYVMDDVEDPIIEVYQKAFPELFKPVSEAPEGLEEHFRYPEDLFRVQTQMWARYHVTDPDTFYNGNDAWTVPQEPGSSRLTGGTTGTAATGADGQRLTPEDRFEPQYLLMRLPGGERESFVMMRPFVAADSGGDDNNQRLLTSFMVANSDPGSYGQLTTYQMPSSNLPDGPNLVADQMKSDSAVGELQTNLCQQGSECELRNLVMIPIGDSLLYVRSFFVSGNESKVPTLSRVIVSFQSKTGTNIAVDETLAGALVKLGFGDVPEGVDDTETDSGSTDSEEQEPDTTLTESQQIDALVVKIVEAFDNADAAARDGDQVAYAQEVEKARRYAQELADLRRATATDNGTSSGSGGTSSGGSSNGGSSGGGSSGTTTTAPATTTTRPEDSTTTTSSAGA